MFKKIIGVFVVLLALSGCASVPMAPKEQDLAKKEFNLPDANSSGVYVYRDSTFGGALKKRVFVNDQEIGKTAPKTYFYKTLPAGKHKLSTESEFGLNHLDIETEGGKNYFVRQYIKMGLIAGGSGLELVAEQEGRNAVMRCNLAQEQSVTEAK